MRVFRITAARLSQSRTEAFTGKEGLYASARWHTAGHPIVYCSHAVSLALLEMLVGLKQTNDVELFNVFEVDIPEKWIRKPATYPAHWKDKRSVSCTFGDAWLTAQESPALLVPTIITAGEWNVLLNPLHPAFSLKWVIRGPEAYSFRGALVANSS